MNKQPADPDTGMKSRTILVFKDIFHECRHLFIDIRSTPANRTYLKILLFMTVTGLILRLFHLGEVSFFIDEANTYYYIQQPVLALWDFTRSSFDGVNPPLFYMIEHFMLFFGTDEFTLRFVPAVFGALTIPVFYFIGKEFCNEKLGIIAAALLTFSAFHVYYSQEARAYTLFLFVFSLALLFYIRALRTETRGSWLLFGFFSVVSFWVHFYAVIMVFPLFLYAILSSIIHPGQDIPGTRHHFEAIVVFIVGSLPLLQIALRAVLIKITLPLTWGIQGYHLIIATFWFFSGAHVVGLYRELELFDPVVFFFLIAFILGLVGIYNTNKDKTYLILTSMAVPFIVSIILSVRVPMDSRYLICLLPFFLIVISFFFFQVQKLVDNEKMIWIVVLIILLVSLQPLFTYYSYDSKIREDWKGFSKEIRNIPGSDDTVIVVPGFYFYPFIYYFNKPTAHAHEFAVFTIADLEKYYEQKGKNRIFFVVCNPEYLDPAGDLQQWIDEHAILVKTHDGIFLYQSG
jgi:mannosyltransferase